MRLKLDLLDGRTFEATSDGRTYWCLADRVAFERQFGVSASTMEQWRDLFEEGKPKPDADVSGVREEYIVFMYWRELRRHGADVPDWDEVMEQVAEFVRLPDEKDDDPVDPTVTDSPPTES